MQVIPVQALPNQSFQVTLNGQACQLNVYQTTYGLFMDLLVNGTIIIAGVICQNANRIVRNIYLGFLGDLAWYDTQGTTDPVFTGLGARYVLVYFSPTDLLTFTPVVAGIGNA